MFAFGPGAALNIYLRKNPFGKDEKKIMISKKIFIQEEMYSLAQIVIILLLLLIQVK